ncbi:MAG: hypothetical protein JXB13_06595 [Phycisphaerae bacterium]|nr:hypothetical protein [Phycisphaerae bacterium]
MLTTKTTTMTRRAYEALRDRRRRRRQEILAQMPAANPWERRRLEQELDRCRDLPPLPPAYVYMLFEPDGTYMGTVRTRQEVRALRQEGIDCTARRAKDLHPDHRLVPEKYRRRAAEGTR